MNKENIFFLALLAIVVLIFATFSVFAFQKEEKLPIITDAMKIKEEFALPNASSSINVSLEDENSFKYIYSENALHLLKNESGILFFGSPTNDISRKMINALNELSKEKNIETIYYLDITKIWDELELDENEKVVTTKEGSNGYYNLLSYLDEYLSPYTLIGKDKTEVILEEKRILPYTLIYVEDGKITNFYEAQKDSDIKEKLNSIISVKNETL